MKNHEWREGMENEAENVEDAVWARETRLTAAQVRFNSLWVDVVLSSVALVVIPLAFWSYWTAMVNCRYGIQETVPGCWASRNLFAIDELALLLLLSVPFLLGILRVRLRIVLLTFALLPIAKSLWPAVMPLLDLQPHMETVTGEPLDMLNYVHFGWATLQQMVGSPLLAWLGWSLAHKLSRNAVRV